MGIVSDLKKHIKNTSKNDKKPFQNHQKTSKIYMIFTTFINNDFIIKNRYFLKKKCICLLNRPGSRSIKNIKKYISNFSIFLKKCICKLIFLQEHDTLKNLVKPPITRHLIKNS
jgi:hypothetical protein